MTNKEILGLLDELFRIAQMQSGGVITSRWFHDADGCPGCGRKIKEMKFKGQNAVSLNTFMYRDHGVLIAYLLCGKCCRKVLRESERNPFGKSVLHDEIEKNLKQGYLKHMGH